MNNPLVSVITVVYNGEENLEDTVKSVLAQTYSNIEYIIIDGGSTDGTIDIIKKYDKEISHWISERDTGMYNAMNKGLKLAKGEILAILNADDYYYPETVKRVVDHFTSNTIDILYGNVTKCRTVGAKDYFVEATASLEGMQKRMGIYHPATFVKRKVHEEIGNYNEKFQLSADYDFILRAYNANYKFQYLAESLTVFRLGGASNTGCKSYTETIEVLKDNNSPYITQIRIAWIRCHLKKIGKQVVRKILYLFGAEKILEKRLQKKWSKQ